MTKDELTRRSRGLAVSGSAARALREALERWKAAVSRAASLPADAPEEKVRGARRGEAQARGQLDALVAQKFSRIRGDDAGRFVRIVRAMGRVDDGDLPLLMPAPDGGVAVAPEALDFLRSCGVIARDGDGWRFALPETRQGERFWYPDRDSVLCFLASSGKGVTMDRLERQFGRGGEGFRVLLADSLASLETEGACARRDGRWVCAGSGGEAAATGESSRAKSRAKPRPDRLSRGGAPEATARPRRVFLPDPGEDSLVPTSLGDGPEAGDSRAPVAEAVEDGHAPGDMVSLSDGLRRAVLEALTSGPRSRDSLEGELCRVDEERRLLADVIEELIAEKRARWKKGRLVLRVADPVARGRYCVLARGGAAVALDNPGDVDPDGARRGAAVPAKVLLPRPPVGVWPGDMVEVRVPAPELARFRVRLGQPEGVFVRLVERGGTAVPVTLHATRRGDWVATPLDPALDGWFPITGVPDRFEDGAMAMALPPASAAGGERNGALRFQGGCGTMESVSVQEKLVKLNHGAPAAFPDDVLAEAAALPPAPGGEDRKGRLDLRALPFVTIDGAAARDFDDAIAVEPLGDGWLLRVAIADVSHYVRAGSALDREALARGNSWYFPTSVEPMLPEALSSGLCSLVPGEDRLVMWVELRIDAAGAVRRADMGTGVIRSFARLTYDGVRDMLLAHDVAALAAFRKETPHADEVLAMLEHALALSRVLRAARAARGSLDFELPEPVASFDADGRVRSLARADNHAVHHLIEECMIAANEAVARRMEASAMDTLYRVHPAPDEAKLESLRGALSMLGISSLGRGGRVDLRAVLREAGGAPASFTVNRLCVRAMQQARYERENGGHYGLASEAYCHFTSPIRRYADLLVHRALKHVMGMDMGRIPVGQRLDRVAAQVNAQERAAMECEREMDRRLACLWMARQGGSRVWHGRVAAVMSFGAFVELDDVPVEGLVPVAALGCGRGAGDWFDYDEGRQCLVGQYSGVTWHVGLGVTVRCAKTDIISLQVDFEPVAVDDGRGDGVPGKDGRRAARRRASMPRGRGERARGGASEPRDGRPPARGSRSRGRRPR